MLFIDVDAMSKLAHWKILPELPNILDIPWSNTSTLSSLVFRARRATQSLDYKLFHSVDAAHLVLETLNYMTKFEYSPDETILQELTDVRAIDAGEAVLLSKISKFKDDRLLTGDKRAIVALTKLPIAEKFVGKIITIEQVILTGLNMHGVQWVRDRVCPFRNIDKMVQVALGSECNADNHHVRLALAAYISEMERTFTPTLLANISNQFDALKQNEVIY